MESRCYPGGEGRTRMKQLHLAARDDIALAVAALFLAGIILLRHFGL
jgi:energy-coupling factor transport system permease protein